MKQPSLSVSLVKAVLDDLEYGPVLSHENRLKLLTELKRLQNFHRVTDKDQPPPQKRGRGRPRMGDMKNWLKDITAVIRRELAAEYYLSLCKQRGHGASAQAVHDVKEWHKGMYNENISQTIIITTASELNKADIIVRPPEYFELELDALRATSSFTLDKISKLHDYREAGNGIESEIPLNARGSSVGHAIYSTFRLAADRQAAGVAEQAAREIGEGLTAYLNDHVLTPDRTRWMSDEQRGEFRARFLNEFVLQLFRKLANAAPSAPP